MRRNFRWVLLSVLGAVLLWTGSVATSAQVPACHAQTLKGSYGYHMSATFPGAPRPVVAVGVFTFDGEGRWSSADMVNANGAISHGGVGGTYIVNGDCTGSASYEWAPGVGGTMHFVVVDNGKELLAIEKGPAAVTIIAKRQ